MIGASDAGAHLDMIDTFTCTTALLGPGVREHGLIPLEEAVHQHHRRAGAALRPARARPHRRGLARRRRRVRRGDASSPARCYTRHDLPAGAGRLYAGAEGIEHVLVNGVEIVRGKQLTGARPGTVLRSGRDTDTVEVPGGRSA